MNETPNWLNFFEDRERRYAAFYLDYARQHARRDPAAYEQLEAEIGNLLKTATWLAGHDEAEGILALATALWSESDFLRTRGFLQRGLPLLEQAHQAARQLRDTRAEIIWLEALADIHLSTGNPAIAQPLFEQALALAQDSDDLLLIARSQLDLGRLLMEMGQLDDGVIRLKQALQNYHQISDYAGQIETLIALGNLLSIQGNPAEAMAYIKQGLLLAQTHQDLPSEVALRFALGYVGTATEDWPLAIKYFEPVIEMARASGNRVLEVRALHNIGEAWLELGDVQKAVNCLEEAVARQEAIDDALTKAFTHLCLGKAYHMLNNWNKSLTQLEQTYPFRDVPLLVALAAEAAWIMADNHLALGNVDLAHTSLLDVLNLAPDDTTDIRQGAKTLLKTIESQVS